MRLLLIDLALSETESITRTCTRHDLTIVDSDAFDKAQAEAADCLIIAGPVIGHRVFPRDVLAMIAGGKAVLGLGAGFAAILEAHGVHVAELADHAPGAAVMRPTEDGAKLFQGSEPIKLTPSDHWHLEELGRGLAVLADSDSGVEGFRHKKYPQIGIQLLPQGFAYQSDAKLIIENTLAAIKPKGAK